MYSDILILSNAALFSALSESGISISYFRNSRRELLHSQPYSEISEIHFVKDGCLWEEVEGKTNSRMARILHQL
ncbi:hypothetical protein CMV_028818 [Castanea mollissima]|uniref:Uncharacterized protein n=1 Tax=Castanea mollissima TaxID=60419 RepID=A0A8J4QFJ5_9ROSI|nr:hypothetical protein CMV_028818 [Castanea mollissima]